MQCDLFLPMYFLFFIGSSLSINNLLIELGGCGGSILLESVLCRLYMNIHIAVFIFCYTAVFILMYNCNILVCV